MYEEICYLGKHKFNVCVGLQYDQCFPFFSVFMHESKADIMIVIVK